MQTPLSTSAPITLDDAKPGQRVRIVAVNGGRGLLTRLSALGLTPGTPIEMVSAGAGPVILSVLGSRLMLGHGMASKILVRTA